MLGNGSTISLWFTLLAQFRRMMPTVFFRGTFTFTWIVFVVRDEPVFNSKEVFAYSRVMVLPAMLL